MAVITLLVFIGIIIWLGIMGIYGRSVMWGNPNAMLGLGALLLLYSFNMWRDKKELVKRCVLALPFALLFIILLKVSGFRILGCCLSGLLLFYTLIIEAKNVKLHYVITLASALILLVLSVLFKEAAMSYQSLYLLYGSAFALLVFYQSYEAKLSRSQKIPKLLPIAINSLKFSVAGIIAATLLLVSHVICRRYNLGFIISFSISVLVAINFLIICKILSIKNPAFSNNSTGIPKSDLL